MASSSPNLSWRCRCGHPLYDHFLVRVVSVAGHKVGRCKIDGCWCLGYESADGSYERRAGELPA